MSRNVFAVLGITTLMLIAFACSDSSKPLAPTLPAATSVLPADGSTLKVNAPNLQSPANNQKLPEPQTAPVLTASGVTPTFATNIALQYRFQVLNAANTIVRDSGLINTTSWQLPGELEFSTRYTWRVRAESQGSVGPWSSSASFVTADGQFLRGNQALDPLTNGKTVGKQVGGHFVPGQGWMADTFSDGIDYDIGSCISCQVEFDVTNFGKGGGVPIDLKWMSMGDANEFGDFNAFRNHPWKMHIEQRGDGDFTGMKLIWRNGDAGGGEPGDHTAKLGSGPNWKDNEVYHFVFQWNPAGFRVTINGDVWFEDGFGGIAYAPPNHRVSLGCYPRAETMVGAIWRNVKIGPL